MIDQKAAIPWKNGLCVLHKEHRPQPALLEQHHIIPVWMQEKVFGKDAPHFPEKEIVCSTGHTNVHVMIDNVVQGFFMPMPYVSRKEKVLATQAISFARQYGIGLFKRPSGG